MRTFLVLVVAASVLATAACDGAVEQDGASSGPAGSGGATSAGTSSTTSGAGGGKTCGGLRGATCASDEYCDFPDDDCGAADASGVCTPRPTTCPHSHQPTCGCDGVVHDNPCEANRAGVDGSVLGTCKPPSLTFACGSGFCRIGYEFCMENAEPPASYGCAPLPDACGAAVSCACLQGVSCGNCMPTPDGGLLLACAAG